VVSSSSLTPVPPKGSEFDREMQMLEAEIKRLEAEYNMFFAGRLPRLPWETRARVDALVKRYDRMPMTNTAARFRFGTLQARFASFCELWEKQLKAKEEGRSIPGRGRKAPPAPDAATRAAAAKQDRDELVHQATFKDPMKEGDRLKELYHQLSEARAKTGEAQIPYHRFAEVVRAQVDKLGRGDREVAFRVGLKEGKVTLTVKAIKDE
jgi:uncharacterized protein (UPF0248 family)